MYYCFGFFVNNVVLRFKDEGPELEEDGVTPNGLMKYKYRGKPFTGIVEYWEDSGYKSGETEYKDGVPDGLSIIYFENGNKQEESYTHFGRIDKYFKLWDEEGNLIRHSIWDDGTKIEQIVPKE